MSSSKVMQMNNTAVIFDFDGVLADSFHFHLGQLEAFLGVPVDPEEYRAVHMGNFFDLADDSVFRGIDWHAYRAQMRPHMRRLPLVSGMQDVLDALAIAGHKMTIISSGCDEAITGFLTRNGVDHHFATVMGMQTCRSKTEKFARTLAAHDLTPERCVYVTDTVGDIHEARAAGIAAIGVTWGYHGTDLLTAHTPYAVAATPQSLLPLIHGFFAQGHTSPTSQTDNRQLSTAN